MLLGYHFREGLYSFKCHSFPEAVKGTCFLSVTLAVLCTCKGTEGGCLINRRSSQQFYSRPVWSQLFAHGEMLRGYWLIPDLCPSNPSFSSLGSTSIIYCRQHLDSSNNTEGSSHTVSLPPCHVLGEWAVDGAIGTPEVELPLALPLRGRSASWVCSLHLNTVPSHPDL